VFRILLLGVEIAIYIYVHKNFSILSLKWDNPMTWYVAVLGIDFAYYWAHRASHGKLWCEKNSFSSCWQTE